MTTASAGTETTGIGSLTTTPRPLLHTEASETPPRLDRVGGDGVPTACSAAAKTPCGFVPDPNFTSPRVASHSVSTSILRRAGTKDTLGATFPVPARHTPHHHDPFATPNTGTSTIAAAANEPDKEKGDDGITDESSGFVVTVSANRDSSDNDSTGNRGETTSNYNESITNYGTERKHNFSFSRHQLEQQASTLLLDTGQPLISTNSTESPIQTTANTPFTSANSSASTVAELVLPASTYFSAHVAANIHKELRSSVGVQQSSRHNGILSISFDSKNPSERVSTTVVPRCTGPGGHDPSSVVMSIHNQSSPNASSRGKKRRPCGTTEGQTSGRWTDQEHQTFLMGLAKYGREWKKVASHIPSRSSAQVRSHAQKYFAKLQREEEEFMQAQEQQQHQQQHGHPDENVPNMLDETTVTTSITGSGSEAASLSQVLLSANVQANVERILAKPDTVQAEVQATLERLRRRYHALQRRLERTENHNAVLNKHAAIQDYNSTTDDHEDDVSRESSTLSSLQNEELIAVSVLHASLPRGDPTSSEHTYSKYHYEPPGSLSSCSDTSKRARFE
jgi:SHAQKYF class myb-like DNA-binding protein